MATNKRQDRNPFMSADLGSGARTTTGGTYENPRLGIQDYTAFGRGVASTFRLPPQKEEGEVKELEGGINFFGREKDEFLDGLEYKENNSLVKNFTEGPLAQMQAQYRKCSKANNQQCLENISKDLGIYQTGQSNVQNLIQKYADDEVYDSRTSKGRFLIDVNGNQIKKPGGGFLEIKDLANVNNNDPRSMNIGLALDQHGDKKSVYQFQMDGETYTVNLTDMTEQYLNNNFDIKDDVMINVQNTMLKDGATVRYTDDAEYIKVGDVTTSVDGDNIELTTTNISQYLSKNTGYIQKALTASQTASRNIHPNKSSANNNSAFYSLNERIKNKSFNTSDEILKEIEDGGYSLDDLSTIPDDLKWKMLQDQVEQEWLIANASKGYKRDTRKGPSFGRAVLRGTELLETKEVDKPVDEEGDGSGYGYSVDNMLNTIELAFGEGRMTGVEGMPGTFKSREMNLPTVVKYLQNHAPKGTNFFSIRDEEAAKNILGSRTDLTEKQRKQFENIIMQKAPGKDAARLIGYIDSSGNIQVTNFNGTVGSLLHTVASLQPKLNTKQLRQAINDKFGVDIEEFDQPDRPEKETQFNPSADPNILSN